jgi:predicted anti-sigma-YlaC factor YlaD
MRNEKHLSEQALNMYLDGELSADERGRVEAHLAACGECRSELLALQALFSALDELAPARAPSLLPTVLAQIRPRRRVAGMGPWFIPALQAGAALALLAWGWTRLVGYWTLVGDILSSQLLQVSWAKLLAWTTIQGTALLAWPGAIWSVLQEWPSRLAEFGSLHLSLAQLAALGAALVTLWLAGNAVLLRRALLNGQVTRRRH